MAEVVITVRGSNESKEIFSSVRASAISAFDDVKSAGKSVFAELKSSASDFKNDWLGAVGIWIDTLDSATTKAGEIIEDYNEQLKTLHEKMMGLGMEVDDDQAIKAIDGVKSALDAIPDVTTKTILLETITSGGGPVTAAGVPSAAVVSGGALADPNAPFGSFAVGTRFVSKTGLAQVHQGEEVRNRGEVRKDRNSQGSKIDINLGGVNIMGSNKSPEQLASEIVRPLRKELIKLDKLLN